MRFWGATLRSMQLIQGGAPIATATRSERQGDNIEFHVPPGTRVRVGAGPHYLRDDDGTETQIQIIHILHGDDGLGGPRDRYGRPPKPTFTRISGRVLGIASAPKDRRKGRRGKDWGEVDIGHDGKRCKGTYVVENGMLTLEHMTEDGVTARKSAHVGGMREQTLARTLLSELVVPESARGK